MSCEKTVTVGDTEVQITETDDGFEVTETDDDEPQLVLVLAASRGQEKYIDPTMAFDIVEAEGTEIYEYELVANQLHVVGGSVTETLNTTADNSDDHEHGWYFNAIDVAVR